MDLGQYAAYGVHAALLLAGLASGFGLGLLRNRSNNRRVRELDARLETANKERELAQSERGLDRKHLEQRASYWYERALPDLSVLRKVEVQRKLRTLAGRTDPCMFRDAVLLMSFEKETFFERDGRIYVKDLSGAKNHGLVQGAKVVEGRIGSALSFDGRDDHVDCGNAPSLNFPTGMSIVAWVSYASLGGSVSDYIVSKDDWRSAERGFVLRIGSSGTAGLTVAASGWRTVRGTTLESNRWYHIAATSDGKELKIFVVGAMKASEVIPGAMIPSPSPA